MSSLEAYLEKSKKDPAVCQSLMCSYLAQTKVWKRLPGKLALKTVQSLLLGFVYSELHIRYFVQNFGNSNMRMENFFHKD